MAPSDNDYYPIRLMPNQIVVNDPDGLVEADKRRLVEMMKPRTISLRFSIIKEEAE